MHEKVIRELTRELKLIREAYTYAAIRAQGEQMWLDFESEDFAPYYTECERGVSMPARLLANSICDAYQNAWLETESQNFPFIWDLTATQLWRSLQCIQAKLEYMRANERA